MQGTQSFRNHSGCAAWQKIQRMAVRAERFCMENADQKGHQFLHQVGFHLGRISASDESQRL